MPADLLALSLENISNGLAALVESAARSIVMIGGRRTSASGFVWRQGVVVTAEEALETEDDLHVTLPDGSKRAATLAGRDPSTDIALLRVEELSVEPVALDVTTALRPGHLALAIGRRPEGPGAALGIVAVAGGPWRSLRGGHIDRTLHLDMRLDPRLEGGAAVNASGRIFGMAVLGPRRRVIVIPSETIERVAPRLLEYGRIARGYAGLGLQPVRIDQAVAQAHELPEARGLMVVGVDSEGPAHAAGLRQGDILVSWGGEPIRSVRDVHSRLGPESVGQSVELGILRGGERIAFVIEIRERPKPK